MPAMGSTMTAAMASPFLVHESFKGGGVVIRDGQGIFGRSGRNARAVGLAEGRGTTAGFDQEAVAVAVVAADEFDDFFPSRIAPGGTDGAHRRFGTGVDHAQFFNGRVDFSDQFGQIRFDDRRGAVAGTAFSCFLKGFDDAGVGVADDHGAPGADVVDVFVAVDVGNGTALGPGDERRRAADAAVGTDRAIDAARHEGLRFGKGSP